VILPLVLILVSLLTLFVVAAATFVVMEAGGVAGIGAGTPLAGGSRVADVPRVVLRE
jgi:hypothetical protein